MASNYAKWDSLTDPDVADSSAAPPPRKPAVAVPNIDQARQRAEKARAAGKAPDPMDALFALGENASAGDLMSAMKALPKDAKEQFLQGLQGPMGTQLLERAAAAKREAQSQPPPAADADAEPSALVGKRVVLANLQARPELNGRRGLCVQWLPARGRLAVRLDDAEEGAEPLAVKPACVSREA